MSHVEVFVTDYTHIWGWQCLDCGATNAGYRAMGTAEHDGDLHVCEES
jgi:hypothetical protein